MIRKRYDPFVFRILFLNVLPGFLFYTQKLMNEILRKAKRIKDVEVTSQLWKFCFDRDSAAEPTTPKAQADRAWLVDKLPTFLEIFLRNSATTEAARVLHFVQSQGWGLNGSLLSAVLAPLRARHRFEPIQKLWLQYSRHLRAVIESQSPENEVQPLLCTLATCRIPLDAARTLKDSALALAVYEVVRLHPVTKNVAEMYRRLLCVFLRCVDVNIPSAASMKRIINASLAIVGILEEADREWSSGYVTTPLLNVLMQV